MICDICGTETDTTVYTSPENKVDSKKYKYCKKCYRKMLLNRDGWVKVNTFPEVKIEEKNNNGE